MLVLVRFPLLDGAGVDVSVLTKIYIDDVIDVGVWLGLDARC
jgi:hypothetical protein